jgi:hypothetical protein
MKGADELDTEQALKVPRPATETLNFRSQNWSHGRNPSQIDGSVSEASFEKYR